MDEVKKMLRAVINGQSTLKDELLQRIEAVDIKLTDKIEGVETKLSKKIEANTERLDKIGSQLAYIEDDTPSREEFGELEGRVEQIEGRFIQT